jgi:hypothetical protein
MKILVQRTYFVHAWHKLSSSRKVQGIFEAEDGILL